MDYHLLGRTGLYVSKICLGTMTYGGQGVWTVIGDLPQDQVDRQVKTAFDAGVNFIDTANVYHEGLSEEMTGNALHNLGLRREEVVLATKVRGRMGKGVNRVGLTRAHIVAELEASLKRLRVDHIDLYQIHGFDPITPMDETLRALDDAVSSGKVRHIGLCNLPAWRIVDALAISERMGWSRFESAQMYYSVAGRDLEREVIPMAQAKDMAILPWSPLAGGLLSGKFDRETDGPQGSRRTAFDFPPVDRDRAFNCLDVIRPIAAARNVSVAQVVLAWTMAQPGITSTIIGARNQQQLEDNLAAADLTLSDEELEAISTVSALPAEYPGWMLNRQGGDRFPGQMGMRQSD